MTYSPDLDMMRSWVQDALPNGKWKDASKIEWVCSIRDEAKPSCYINIEKRTYCDFGGDSGKLSELCERQGIADPYRKEDEFHTRTPTPPTTVSKNSLIALDRWVNAQPATDDFGYLKRKGVPSMGLRVDTDNTMGEVLLVPAYDTNGQVVGIERISHGGEKQHLGTKKEAYFLIGEPKPGEQVYIAEGYATAASIHQLTSRPVAVSFSHFNLGNVGNILERKGFKPTVCPDSGASPVHGFRNILTPDGTHDKQDWNDIHQEHGLDEARRMFREQEAKSTIRTEAKDERATFKVKKMNARELYQTPLASPTWAIDQMIPQGLSVIASPPKTGKSYFVLQSAFAVARGEKFLGYRTTKGKVLLISLEDTFNRLQKRIVQVCPDTSKIPDNLDMTVEFPRLDSEGLACLEKEIKENEYCLVILDTWGKTKPNGQAKRSENVYETDVRLVSEVKKLADKYGISILLVHHLKKGGGASKDWLESLSGSMGLSATVDGLLALERDRGSDIGILKRSGRDLEDDEDLGLNWLAPGWEFNGSAVQMKLNATKKKILESIERAREPVKPAYIATDTGINSNTVRGSLNRMLFEGLLSITSDGKYMIPVKRETIDDEDDDDFSNASNRANRANASNSPNSPNSPNNQSVCLIEGESNSKSNSSLVSDTIDLAPSVSTVSTVCYTGDISSSSGKPTEQESKQEYSEAEAREWLKTNPEAKRMYQQKRDRMMQTINDKQHCFRVALKRTWEHFHK